MPPKSHRRVFTDVPNTDTTKKIADIIEYAATQVHRGSTLRQYLVRKMTYHMIVSEDMILHSNHFGKRLQTYLNRSDLPTPQTEISGRRILPRIAYAIFSNDCHQPAVDHYFENVAKVAQHNNEVTSEEHQSGVANTAAPPASTAPSSQQYQHTPPASPSPSIPIVQSTPNAPTPIPTRGNSASSSAPISDSPPTLPPEAQSIIQSINQSFKDQLSANAGRTSETIRRL